MSDITMCEGTECTLKEKCHRYTALISQYGQSFFTEIPGKPVDGKTECEYFWDNEGRKRYR